MDVAPAPDLIIRRIAQVIYGLKTIPTADFVRKKMECWKPYRSIASMYLWQATKMKVTQADLRRGRTGSTKLPSAARRFASRISRKAIK
jgi:3-methyladenine DNA glycosylase/8-oxoguanine DNA glycosylase